MSKIAETTAANLLAVFAGQTVTMDALIAQMEMVYAMNNKRMAVGSFFKVDDILEANGVVSQYSGFNYTGTRYSTFPAN